MQTKSAYLVLENGMVFCGQSIGYEAEAIGEIVFSTSMVGCLGTLTDPNFCGQIVVETFPLIGNYGVISKDLESKGTALAAYIVRDLCQEPSNFRSEGALGVFLSEHKVVGLADIDTRALTRIIRSAGSMKAKITFAEPDVDAIRAELAAFCAPNAVEAVTCKEASAAAPADAKHRVVLWDFGAKDCIGEALLARGCEVITVPAGTSAKDILAYDPDGILLSNGPGDPAANPEIIAEIKAVTASGKPMFGIDLGNLMLAIAMGAKTEKMLHGHRGSQPAIRLSDKRVFITSQNYGYTINEEQLPETIEVSYKNGNDAAIEGVEYKTIPAFGVQFMPSSVGGPIATDFLYDTFIGMME